MPPQITYSGAILEVCMRKLVFYPEVVAFIEEEKDQFPSVKVQYLFASPPRLIMLDDDGQHKESIRYVYLMHIFSQPVYVFLASRYLNGSTTRYLRFV